MGNVTLEARIANLMFEPFEKYPLLLHYVDLQC